jgi:hypothetical protein
LGYNAFNIVYGHGIIGTDNLPGNITDGVLTRGFVFLFFIYMPQSQGRTNFETNSVFPLRCSAALARPQFRPTHAVPLSSPPFVVWCDQLTDFHTGLLFSKNAATPSSLSAVPNAL